MFNCTGCNVTSSHLGVVVRHQHSSGHGGIVLAGLRMRRVFPDGDGERQGYLAELDLAERQAEETYAVLPGADLDEALSLELVRRETELTIEQIEFRGSHPERSYLWEDDGTDR